MKVDTFINGRIANFAILKLTIMVIRLLLNLFLLFLPLAIAAKPSLATADITDENRLLSLLDNYTEQRQQYVAKKESKLNGLKMQLRTAASSGSRLAILNRIYREYYTFCYDSAMVYAQRGLQLAEQEGDSYYTTLNKINRAAVLSTGGFYSQSEALLKEIGTEAVPQSLRQYYYYTFAWLYNYWSSFCRRSEFEDDYRSLKTKYLQLTVAHTSKRDTALHAYLSGELLFLSNPVDRSMLNLYMKALHSSRLDTRVHASAAYCVARYYKEVGDMKLYEKYIVEAAISDMVCPLKENLALQEFSTYLYKRDRKYATRAARYIYCSMEDAKFYNNRLRMLEISSVLPVIAAASQEAVAHQERLMRGVLAVVSFLTLALLAMSYFGYKQNKWLTSSRREVKEQNTQLANLNERLMATNSRRETYMRLFIDISAVYIRKLDEYRKLVKRKIKVGQTADLLRSISSYRLAEEESVAFYNRFDKAFMELYPDFASELNDLLVPEAQIKLPSPNSLTTEVRIYALMRLGVTDSQEIATLLFYSTQTIYNYKSAMRAKAKNRETFESDINQLCHIIK